MNWHTYSFSPSNFSIFTPCNLDQSLPQSVTISNANHMHVISSTVCNQTLCVFLVVFVNNHEKRLNQLDTLSSELGKKFENLTKEDEKLKEIIEGRWKYQIKCFVDNLFLFCWVFVLFSNILPILYFVISTSRTIKAECIYIA